MQVLLADMMVHPIDPALQCRKMAFDGVRCDAHASLTVTEFVDGRLKNRFEKYGWEGQVVCGDGKAAHQYVPEEYPRLLREVNPNRIRASWELSQLVFARVKKKAGRKHDGKPKRRNSPGDSHYLRTSGQAGNSRKSHGRVPDVAGRSETAPH